MVDFRSESERQRDARQAQREQQDYKVAFDQAQRDMSDLKARMSELEEQNQALQSKLADLVNLQAESIRAVRAQVEAGMAKLTEDNTQMHAMIQSAQTEDLKLVEQMDRNHRERLESIVRLVDKEGLSYG